MIFKFPFFIIISLGIAFFLMIFFKKIISFELIFTLLIFSFQYKNCIPLFNKPDINLYLILILLPWSWALFKNEKGLFLTPAVLSFTIFGLWLLLSVSWSFTSFYSINKSVVFILYTIPSFIIAVLLSFHEERLKRLLNIYLNFSLLITGLVLLFHFLAPHQLPSLFNTTYIITGQTLGVGFILLFSRFLSPSLATFGRPFYLIVVSIIVFTLLIIGGRGPLIHALISVFFMFFLAFQHTEYKKYVKHSIVFLMLLSMGCTLVYYFFPASVPFLTLNRLLTFIAHPDLDGAFIERTIFWKASILSIIDSPLFGLGFGGWASLKEASCSYPHPHNLFLEITTESGIIALVLLMIFLFQARKTIINSSIGHRHLFLPLSGIFCFSLLNAQKSGDLNENILLWSTLGLLIGASLRNKKI